jgi:purine-binding chemotaxis protein CheW
MAELLMGASTQPSGERPGAPGGTGQFLTFFCADEEFGVDILRVREIKGWTGVTQVPEAPSHVLGIMNLRGDIVPVIDLRTRFGLERRKPDASTVLIVVSVTTPRGESTVGVCVDGVSDVHGFEAESIKPSPDLGARDTNGYVHGVVSRDAKILMLLDIDKVIGNATQVREAA